MIRNRKYLDYLRSQPCVLTGLSGSDFDAIDPMHIGTAGKGIKSDDSEALPVLHSIHQDMHQRGEVTVLLEHLANNKRLLRDMARAYARQEYERWLQMDGMAPDRPGSIEF
jgi:hypothetical protein